MAYHSQQFIPAKINYPTHEQELLAIVDTLAVWRNELMGLPFVVPSDHLSLRAFMMQKNLSRRQARWTEALADYEYTIVYIPGERNTIADAMSRYSFSVEAPALVIAGISEVSISTDFISQVKVGYTSDAFCVQALKNVKSVPGS